jgi:hypothetical protein
LAGVRNFTLFVNFLNSFGKKCIFQQFLPLMRPRPYNVAPPICRCITESWKISCRYAYVFRKLNSTNPINHNLSFCESRSSSPFVKCVFVKINFTRGMLDLSSQKLRLGAIWLVEFNFLKTSTYLHEICQLFMIHLQFASVNFWAKIASKVKIVEKFLTFPNKADNFTNKVKFLTPANIYVES